MCASLAGSLPACASAMVCRRDVSTSIANGCRCSRCGSPFLVKCEGWRRSVASQIDVRPVQVSSFAAAARHHNQEARKVTPHWLANATSRAPKTFRLRSGQVAVPRPRRSGAA